MIKVRLLLFVLCCFQFTLERTHARETILWNFHGMHSIQNRYRVNQTASFAYKSKTEWKNKFSKYAPKTFASIPTHDWCFVEYTARWSIFEYQSVLHFILSALIGKKYKFYHIKYFLRYMRLQINEVLIFHLNCCALIFFVSLPLSVALLCTLKHTIILAWSCEGIFLLHIIIVSVKFPIFGGFFGILISYRSSFAAFILNRTFCVASSNTIIVILILFVFHICSIWFFVYA